MLKLNKFFIIYLLIIIFLGFKGEILISLFFIFLHELFHYITARKYGFKGFNIEILPFGAKLNLKDLDDLEPLEDLVISLSGPLLNLILAVIFYCLTFEFSNIYFFVFFKVNITLAIFNLTPVLPLDGGRIFRDLLSLKFMYKKANKITIYFSLCIGIFIMYYYIYIFLLGNINIVIGLIALFILLNSLKEKERIAYIIMGDIIKKRYKFIKKGYIENKSISLYYKNALIDVLSIIDKNKYNIFTIMNDEMKVIDIIYENEIIDALKDYGNITLEEFIDRRKYDI